MDHQCGAKRVDSLVFTSHTGEVFEMEAEDLPTSCPLFPNYVDTPKGGQEDEQTLSFPVRVDGPAEMASESLPLRQKVPRRREPSCGSTSPLIAVVNSEDLPDNTLAVETLDPEPPRYRSPSPRRGGDTRPSADIVKASMIYNEYGELVSAQSLLNPPTPGELSVTQILRVIKKAYHHDFRHRMSEIIVSQMDGKSSVVVEDGSLIWSDRISSWEFRPRSPKAVNEITPEECRAIQVYHGSPRVLEIGCSDGNWCFKIKKEQPDWIIEGVDDTDHWSCVHKEVLINDFIDPKGGSPDDYFSRVPSSQSNPEFTVRNLNCLLTHKNSFPHNLYGLIRGRDIFDRVESYKSFLEDVRTILQPDGVVEFLEIDPRPRTMAIECIAKAIMDDHKSGPQTDWTDKITDRFKDPLDEQLATTVPGWAARVAERLKASLRPRDGVPAANLKSWLEGAGFWDVKQLVLRLPVGGNTRSGQLLKNFVLYQISLEGSIPKLLESLPKVELQDLENGSYYLNLHIVTARKPHQPRAGDLLIDGTRQEMTDSKYDVMARFNDAKSNQWKRFDLDGKLTTVMESLARAHGPDLFTPPSPSTSLDESFFPLLARGNLARD